MTNVFELKREGRWAGLSRSGSMPFELERNGQPFWEVEYVRRRIYRITPADGSTIELKKRWPILPIFDLYKNDRLMHSFWHKTTKIEGEKLWVDSRSFINLGWDKVCTIDPWEKAWPGGESVVFRWEHNNADLELPITVLGLLAAVDYADRN